MQTTIQVICTKGNSLREKIARDGKLKHYDLSVEREKLAGRSPGWLKLRSTDRSRKGAVNVAWDASTHILSCRIINKGAGKPDRIVADLVNYLLSHRRQRIRAITILLG